MVFVFGFVRMRTMASKTLIRIITALIFFVVVGTPLFYQRAGIFPYTLGKALFFQAAVEIVLAFWLVLVVFYKEYRPKITPLITALFVFIGALLLTAFLGEDPWRSFWSTYERGFGVFAIMHLAALAVVLSSLGASFPWRRLFYVSLGMALTISVLAIFQLNIPNLLLEEPTPGRPGATFGNPAFLAGYLLFQIFLAAYLLFDIVRRGLARNKVEILAFAYLTLVLLAAGTALFLTQTRGDVLGLAAAVFVLLFLFALDPPEIGVDFFARRKPYVILIAVVIIVGSMFWFTRTSSFWTSVPALARFSLVSLDSESLQPRIIAARAAWRGFLDNPVFGVGWDNFNIIFNKYYDPRVLRVGYQETRFDKPHNFILEDMVSGGIVLALAHLAVLAFFIRQSLKIKDKLLGQFLVAAAAGYFVRNLFIFDTIGPALAFYVFFGYVGWHFMEKTAVDQQLDTSKNIVNKKTRPFLAGAVIVSLIFAYMVNIRVMLASNYHFRGFIDMAKGRADLSISNFRKALDIWNPYRWNFVRDYAAVMAERYFYNPGAIPREAVLDGIKEMEAVAKDHPKDAYNHYFLVDLYNQTSDLDQLFLDKAEREAEIALKLSPNRQQVLFSLAKTKTLKNDYESAIFLARKALALDENVADAHFYYGLLSFVRGDQETGYKELKIAIEMGKKWKNFNEPLTIANFFADYGKIEEALELYGSAHLLNRDDPEVIIKAGVASFILGRNNDARTWFEIAGNRLNFDFRESPAFADIKPILDELGIRY